MINPAPRETHEKKLDFLNPVEVAKLGYQKSAEALRSLLGMKEEAITKLKPSDEREKEQLAVAQESVSRRRLLAQEINPVLA